MKELFKKQLENNIVVTEEMLEKIKIKKYKNGDDIKIGDKVLYAIFTDMPEEIIKAKTNFSNAPMERNCESHEIKFELITLNESQFDLYTYDERLQYETNGNIPIIQRKNNERQNYNS